MTGEGRSSHISKQQDKNGSLTAQRYENDCRRRNSHINSKMKIKKWISQGRKYENDCRRMAIYKARRKMDLSRKKDMRMTAEGWNTVAI